MGMRRRPLARAAVVGGVAYHAGKKGQQSRDAEADQNAQIADLQAQQAQQQYAPPPPQYAEPAPAAPAVGSCATWSPSSRTSRSCSTRAS